MGAGQSTLSTKYRRNGGRYFVRLPAQYSIVKRPGLVIKYLSEIKNLESNEKTLSVNSLTIAFTDNNSVSFCPHFEQYKSNISELQFLQSLTSDILNFLPL